jgi:hypothetical protein
MILQVLSIIRKDERGEDPHADECKQLNISAKEIKYLLKAEHQQRLEKKRTHHWPAEWFFSCDELPIEIKRDNPFPAMHHLRVVNLFVKVFNLHIYP